MALRRRWWWRWDRRRRERRAVAIVFLGFRVLRGFGVFGNLGSIVGQAIDSIEIEREREREREICQVSFVHRRIVVIQVKNVYFVMV